MTKLFKKTVKQSQATKIAGDPLLKHFMAFGGSRSGKSFDHVRRIFIRAAKVKSRHLIARQKFNHVKTSIWHETIPTVLELCFPNLKPIPNKTDFFYTLKNGSEIWIAGLDDKERTEKILGKEYSTIMFNECTQISFASRNMVLTRLAEKNSLRKICYYDMNPPPKSHWTYWLWVKHYDPLSEEPIDPREYQSVLMNPTDNLENIDGDYIKMLEALPEKERQRFLLGEFQDNNDGVVYYEFDRDQHVKDVTKMPGTILCGMDFNVNPMTSVQCSYVNGQFHIFDEIYQENSDTPKMVSELCKRGYSGAWIYPDSTGKNRKTSGLSDFQIIKENGFVIKGVTNPLVQDRVNNINRLLKSNRIIINPKCKKLINDLEKVSWKDNQLDQKGENKMLTHISDALGYLCWAIDNGLTSTIPKGLSLYQRRNK